jgi:hypothetical protein
MEARPADPEGEGCLDPLFPRHPQAVSPEAEGGQIGPGRLPWRSSPAGGQEEEARSFLVRVAEEGTTGICAMVILQNVHAGTLAPATARCLNNPGNYG